MPKPVIFKSTNRFGNAVGGKPNKDENTAHECDASIKILGKLCPYCGEVGGVLCETTQRIIYECSNQHQYETKKQLGALTNGTSNRGEPQAKESGVDQRP